MFRLALIALLCSAATAVQLETEADLELSVDEWMAEAEEDTKMPSAKEIMGFFDTSKDGKISKKEFFAGLMKIARMHKYKPTKKDREIAGYMFDKADQSGDGHVDMRELMAAIDWCKQNLK